jgi:ABC-type nitrate/sulfonate/bicarbonate transport system substrate-binding protein
MKPFGRSTTRTAAALAALLALAACGGGAASGGSSGSKPSEVKMTYFENADPMQDDLIATMPSLQKMVPVPIKWLPVQSGPGALAGYKAGSYDFVESVGNPGITGAMAAGLPFHVIWPETQDSTVLVVKPSIQDVSQLAGKTIADLVGSSEDYEFGGFLKANKLQDKVKIVQLGNMQDTVPAFKTGRVDGAFADWSFALAMLNAGGVLFKTGDGHQVDAAYICSIGYCSFNSATVADSFAKKYPSIVQAVVCTLAAATRIEEGPKEQADAAFKGAMAFTGNTDPQAAVEGGEHTPTIPPEKVAAYLSPAGGDPDSGVYAKSILNTAQFLQQSGKLPKPLTLDQIQSRLDASWAKNVVAGKCPKQ